MTERVVGALVAFAGLAGLILGGCRLAPGQEAWRHQQEEAIAAVVLKDLTELPPDGHDPTVEPETFCAFVGEPTEAGEPDPPETLIRSLRADDIDVFPSSECEFPAYRLKVDGRRVALIGVQSIEWKSDNQVRVKASRLIGPLAGNGWVYTLSNTSRGWLVDFTRDDWIA